MTPPDATNKVKPPDATEVTPPDATDALERSAEMTSALLRQVRLIDGECARGSLLLFVVYRYYYFMICL